jgi:hypothetical protein
MFMELFSSASLGSDCDLCTVDHAVNHPLNAVKQRSRNTPLSARHLRSFLRYRRLVDEARLVKVISLVFRGCFSAGVCMPGPPKCG